MIESSKLIVLFASSAVGFILCWLLFPLHLRLLKRLQVGQYIREEGPSSHLAKAHTPTMGGACFMVMIPIISILLLNTWHMLSPASVVILCMGFAGGLLGLIDDLTKLRKKANAGLSARFRLLCEFGFGALLAALLLHFGNNTGVFVFHEMKSNPVSNFFIVLPVVLYVLISAFYFAASANAMNLHDGMDGLAAGTSIQVLASVAILLLFIGHWDLAVISATAAGSIGAFLVFNKYPARIFMGDTGSLFIGSLLASIVIAGQLQLWFIPLALIYIVETLSVIVQVVYFKLTKPFVPNAKMSGLSITWMKLTKRLPGEGKRFLRMAPLHHHFESMAADHNLNEWHVVLGFWLMQLLLCLLVLLGFCAQFTW